MNQAPQNNPLLPRNMTAKARDAGVGKVNKHPAEAFLLAITAGGLIAIAFIFYTAVTTGADFLGYGPKKLLGGLCFSVGLILIVVNGGELFTGSTLAVVARASGRVSTLQMLKNWALVYVGNFVGAITMAAMMFGAAQHTFAGGRLGLNYLQIAQGKMHHDFGAAILLGIGCNILVCSAIWMTFSAKTLTDKAVACVLPVAMFVAAGFEHCVANMFQIPMALFIKDFADPTFFAGLGVQAADFADLSWSGFFLDNLLPVTLGNIIGGAGFVGVVYWWTYLRHEPVVHD